MAGTLIQLDARTRGAWRRWLARNHASSPGVWLLRYKPGTGVTMMPYEDVVCEALCFGWVDSLVKRLDDRRYAVKVTPRRADSRWSEVNRRRYAELKAAGRLEPPGIARPPTGRGYGPRPPRLELPSRLPAYIQAALRRNRRAARHFEALPSSERRRYFAWIESARREDTKRRRLKEAIRLLSRGDVLGLK